MKTILICPESKSLTLLEVPHYSDMLKSFQNILHCNQVSFLTIIDKFHEVYVDDDCILNHNLSTWSYDSDYFCLHSLPGPCLVTGRKLTSSLLGIQYLDRRIRWNGVETIGVNTREYYG